VKTLSLPFRPVAKLDCVEMEETHTSMNYGSIEKEQSMKIELTEARRIILALAGIRERLKECDVRFLESWQSYLQNAPEPTIGRWRLHNLRTVAETYYSWRSACSGSTFVARRAGM
jgi:hypothetical protein